jgi:hypothetical protein
MIAYRLDLGEHLEHQSETTTSPPDLGSKMGRQSHAIARAQLLQLPLPINA